MCRRIHKSSQPVTHGTGIKGRPRSTMLAFFRQQGTFVFHQVQVVYLSFEALALLHLTIISYIALEVIRTDDIVTSKQRIIGITITLPFLLYISFKIA